jgi:hypothetical protein
VRVIDKLELQREGLGQLVLPGVRVLSGYKVPELRRNASGLRRVRQCRAENLLLGDDRPSAALGALLVGEIKKVRGKSPYRDPVERNKIQDPKAVKNREEHQRIIKRFAERLSPLDE